MITSILVLGCQNQNKGIEFFSAQDCQASCKEEGFTTGNCKWTEELDSTSLNMGPCLIETSEYCGKAGQCYCYCYDVDVPLAEISR